MPNAPEGGGWMLKLELEVVFALLPGGGARENDDDDCPIDGRC